MKTPWHSLLLLALLIFFTYLTLSGLFLFFLTPGVLELSLTAEAHTYLGLLLIPLFIAYQLKHYLSVRKRRKQIHYIAGVVLTLCVLGEIITGLFIWYGFESAVLELAHSLIGFVFMIVFGVHIILVARIWLSRVEDRQQFYTEILLKRVVAFTSIVAVLLLAIIFVSERFI